MTTPEELREPYRLPDEFTSMTIHHLYGISEQAEGETIDGYFAKNGFALIADLLEAGLSREEIEAAVNSGKILVGHWPKKEPKSDFFWVEDEPIKAKLAELADRAVELCYGDEHQPVGGNFASVGAEIGSQQLAIAGLIYAREQGTLREIPEMDNGAGPLYVVRDSFSGRMFEQVLPEEA